MRFVPYSSKSEWVRRYPHAYPYVNCDAAGNVSGFPHWSHRASCALDVPPEVVDASMRPSTVEALAAAEMGGDHRGRHPRGPASRRPPLSSSGHRLSGSVLLTNAERHVLHAEIYEYFSWLTEQVIQLETSESGRRAVKRANVTASGLRGMLAKLEGMLKVAAGGVRRRANDAGTTGTTTNGGGVEGGAARGGGVEAEEGFPDLNLI